MGNQTAKDLRPIGVQNANSLQQQLSQQLIQASSNPNINPNVTRIATIAGLKHGNKQRQKFGANIFIEHNEALLQNRPLPEIPDHSSSSAASGVIHSMADESPTLSAGFIPMDCGSGGGSGGGVPPQRWMSKENLLSQTDEPLDPQLFVALYEFHSGGENQLSLRKDEGNKDLQQYLQYNILTVPYISMPQSLVCMSYGMSQSDGIDIQTLKL
ncbi:unnamed protein product [Medioppia subpectinata]|uniref:Uncharacterized protein n=1 Tax=Medioppia subpectinata TaxID=1979941 RepID=A0A7R9KLK7_9ACAR|nr:unnamed protein product [Medioppia subpectinata]CAG2105839.1 unnamed protein product [Medioppia subpectinata]